MNNVNRFHIDINDLNLSVQEVAGEIGYTKENIPEFISSEIQNMFHEFGTETDIAGGFKVFDNIELQKKNIFIEGTQLNTSKIISKALNGSAQIAVFACTLGETSDMIIRKFKDSDDFVNIYLADHTASYITEKSAEYISFLMRKHARKYSMNITNRFSPGYCNWDVSEQKQLFSLLPENFCGIQLNEYAMMTPLKSISGIIGIGKEVSEGEYYCSECTITDCLFLKHKKRIYE
jgi:hypothetical protein